MAHAGGCTVLSLSELGRCRREYASQRLGIDARAIRLVHGCVFLDLCDLANTQRMVCRASRDSHRHECLCARLVFGHDLHWNRAGILVVDHCATNDGCRSSGNLSCFVQLDRALDAAGATLPGMRNPCCGYAIGRDQCQRPHRRADDPTGMALGIRTLCST